MIWALVAAVLTAVVPSIQQEAISWYAVGFSAALAALAWVTKNFEGKILTIVGILLSAGTNFFMAHPDPEGLTVEYVLKNWAFPLVLQFALAKAATNKQE
jgi:hypothetical protein